MTNIEGCQIPCLPQMAEGRIANDAQPLIRRLKRSLAVPWNYHVKRWLKALYQWASMLRNGSKMTTTTFGMDIKPGDQVRVRSWDEIQTMLNPFKELRGCAFLPEMKQYCGSTQRVLQVMERFLDERDYKVKKVNGVVLLENVICHGTPVYGRCDRCCHLFWRIEWLEKIQV